MFKQKVLSLIVGGLLVLAPTTTTFAGDNGASASAAVRAKSCVFDKYPPAVVVPYKSLENVGYGNYSFVKGAQVYVSAQPGLTKEWLQLTMQRAFASEGACRPGVKSLQVAVVSAGNGFWVQFIASDVQQADAVLDWAKDMVRKYTSHPAAAPQIDAP